jgi:hypothetical protein
VKKLVENLLWSGAITALLVALFGATQWREYESLTFNSEGRYFDSEEEIEYTVDGLAGWQLVTLAGSTTSAALAFLATRARKRRA